MPGGAFPLRFPAPAPSRARGAGLSRRALPLLLLMPASRPARGEVWRHVITEREGRITFSARHLGLLRSEGEFRRFRTLLELDPERPEATRIAGTVETGSASVAYPGADEMLRSEAFFDSARYPEALFEGVALGAGRAWRFPIEGTLTLRGISRPWLLEARLLGREGGQALFVAVGRLSRRAYGMVAERLLIGDEIVITISVRVPV
ncbi:MAG: YceI family protein [Roseococcus sp.]